MTPRGDALGSFVAVVITRDAHFLGETLGAARDFAPTDVSLVAELAPPTPPGPEPPTHAIYIEALAKARRYAARSAKKRAITVVHATTLDGAAARCETLGQALGPVGMVYVDAASTELEDEARLDERIDAFYARLALAGRSPVRSPYALAVHRRAAPWTSCIHTIADRYASRVLQPDVPWLLRAEQLISLVDFLERTLDRPRNHTAATREPASTLGDALVRFLDERAGPAWLFLHYTGTSVSPLVDHLDHAARGRGVLSLRAANEHGLAAGALAAHLLHGRPSLIVVGTGMMDELRGTLASLRSAGAQGFIVCPEADEGSWFSFQGTLTPDEDMRASLAARGVPCVYFEAPETMSLRIEDAFRLYDEGRGPVALLVTQQVLDEKRPLPLAPRAPPPRAIARVTPAGDNAVERALAILGKERVNVLWQTGRLDDEGHARCHAIAERAGIAVCDTFAHPGPSHRDRAPLPNYLGTLGLYGMNQRAHAFLHPGGRLAPRAEHCVFFLNSKLGQRATNFTPFRRAGLRMAQVTRRADHVAPDVELALVMECHDFLRAVDARLEVEPEVLRHRQAALRLAMETSPEGRGLASRMPSLPMSPGAFFRALRALFASLIEDEGYAYTGVYDVGRCAVSALRSVPRTGRGFSAWYGRAMMGDASAALPTLATLEAGNVVAFVGDGARAMVADPLPALLENAAAHPARFDENVTVFVFSNGTFSGIRAYRERLASRWGGRQVRILDVLPEDGEFRAGPLHVVRRRMHAFDREALREALLARGRLNLFTVLLGHDDEDDGFSFVSPGWQRDGGDA